MVVDATSEFQVFETYLQHSGSWTCQIIGESHVRIIDIQKIYEILMALKSSTLRAYRWPNRIRPDHRCFFNFHRSLHRISKGNGSDLSIAPNKLAVYFDSILMSIVNTHTLTRGICTNLLSVSVRCAYVSLRDIVAERKKRVCRWDGQCRRRNLSSSERLVVVVCAVCRAITQFVVLFT